MIARLRGEIAAAISLGAGALIATGYGITAARLHNIGVPASPALGTLPGSYFLGEALQAIVLPLVLLLTIGAIWLALFGDGKRASAIQATLPNALRWCPWPWTWRGLGLFVVACAWVIDVLTHHGELDGASRPYWLAVAGPVIAVPLLTEILYRLVFTDDRLKDKMAATSVQTGAEESSADNREGARRHQRRDLVVLAALLAMLVSIIGASSIRIVNAGFLSDPLPAAFVSADPENCTLLGPRVNTGHCYFAGYYLGESSQWLFLVWEPTTGQIRQAKIEAAVRLRARKPKSSGNEVREAKKDAAAKFRNRIVMLPRDDVLQVLVADSPEDLPEVARPPKPSVVAHSPQTASRKSPRAR